jgi:hypothetical protein
MARTDDDPTTGFERGRAPVATPGSAGWGAPVEPTAEYPSVADRVGASAPGDGATSDGGTGRVDPPQPAVVGGGTSGGGFPRSLFWLAATVALVLLTVAGVKAVGLWPSLSNPFASRQTDRSQPVLLKSIQDLSRFVGAEGNFEVVVDLQNNTKYIPDFLVSERTLFVAAGTVEAYVDFGDIGQNAITESADHRTVQIKLPAPALGKPNIDNDRSYVFATQKGLLNHLGDLVKDDPNRMQEIYKLAEDKIAASANGSGLPDRAKENTRKMLETLLRSLGYTSVTVTFAAP